MPETPYGNGMLVNVACAEVALLDIVNSSVPDGPNVGQIKVAVAPASPVTARHSAPLSRTWAVAVVVLSIVRVRRAMPLRTTLNEQAT